MTILLSRQDRLKAQTNPTFRIAFSVLVIACGLGVSLFVPDAVVADSEPAADDLTEAVVSIASQTPVTSGEDDYEAVSNPGTPDQTEPSSNQSTKVRGFVTAKDAIDVASQIDGVIVSLKVSPGDKVKKGQIVAKFDDTKAVAEIQAAKVELDALARAADNKLDIELAKSNLEGAREALAYAEQLFKRGNSPEQEVSVKKLAVLQAEIALKKTFLDLDASRLKVAAGEGKLRTAELGLSQHVIRAPIDGIVTKLYRRPTEWSKAGSVICRIVSLERLLVRGSVSASKFNSGEMEKFKTTVSVRLARGEQVDLPGETIFADPEVTPTRQFEVQIECKNKKRAGRWLVSPGMEATITFLTESDANDPLDQASTPGPTAAQGENDVEVKFLVELVRSAKDTFDRVNTKYEQGIEGGNAASKAMAELHLKSALAKLAVARREYKHAMNYYKQAISAAEQHLNALQVQAEAGVSKYESLIQAQRNLAQIRLDYYRLMKSASSTQSQ